jgi:hypothetical protein
MMDVITLIRSLQYIACCTCNWLISINLTAAIDSVLCNIELKKYGRLHMLTKYSVLEAKSPLKENIVRQRCADGFSSGVKWQSTGL